MERFVDEPPRFKVAVANRPGAGLANRYQDVKRQVGVRWAQSLAQVVPGFARALKTFPVFGAGCLVCSRRRIVEFMGEPGRHRAKLDELLALLCVARHIAQSRGEHSHDFPRLH
jgi:hypothetical protein